MTTDKRVAEQILADRTPTATPDLAAELAELERLAREATPGPWTYGGSESAVVAPVSEESVAETSITADAAYIAAANPTVVLRLLRELRSLRARPPVDVERPLDMAALRRDVLAMQPVRRTFAYRQGFDDAVLIVLARLRAAAAPAGEDRE